MNFELNKLPNLDFFLRSGIITLAPSPESMPPELVNLREDIDAISTTQGKDQAVNQWIDVFLQVMNEGEAQAEIQGGETDEQGTADRETDNAGREPGDTETPRGAAARGTQTRSPAEDTPTPGERTGQRGDGSERGDTADRTRDGDDGTQRALGTAADDSQRAELGRSDAAGGRTVGGLEPETPIDTNQVVGVSRRREPQETSTVSPVVQSALDTLNISSTEWEQLKADGEAITFLNNQPQETIEQIDAVGDLAGDVAGIRLDNQR